MSLTIFALMAGLSLGGLLGFIAGTIVTIGFEDDDFHNISDRDDDGSLWPRNSKEL